MADSKTFSLRIVSLDYYMASPIQGIDFSYSSFQGGKVNEVPVIRIYGSTPAGQKTCLHIHRVLPYLYVPCTDIPFQNQDEDDAYLRKISLAIDKALQLKSKASSKRQYVHGCSLVRGKKFYGYHSSEELFVKIYLYYPHDVSRAANLLLGGGVLGKCLQPHEAHIPYILQFLVDYNLFGMGHIHLSKVKFRHPVPDVFCRRKSVHTEQSKHDKNPLTCGDSNSLEDLSGSPCFDSPVWTSSTIPAGWMWHSTTEFDDSSSNQGSNFVKRQSLCHLEGDSTADEILNQDCKAFTSLSQTRSDVHMVQSLVSIWEEEYKRTGMQEIGIHSDPGKPLPEDVLKTLSLDPELFIRFYEQPDGAEKPSLTQSDQDVKSALPIISLPGCVKETGATGYLSSQEKDGIISSTDRAAYVKSSSKDELGASPPFERLDDKAEDKEALGLLKWLASSQAVDDINSDDELLRETILSPFLPENTIEEVLERANMEYESESQKECQEILDSTQDVAGSKDMKEMDEFPATENLTRTSYHNIIPQVDGSGDHIFLTPDELIETQPDTTPKKIDEACENSVPEDTLLENRVVEDAHSTFTQKHKRKTILWGSLPLSTKQEHISYCSETIGPTTDPLSEFKIGQHETSSVKNLKETKSLGQCSVRDLMRRKRKYQVKSVQCSSEEVEKIPSEMEQREDTLISPKKLDFQTFQVNEPNKRTHSSINLEMPLASSQSMLHEAYAADSPPDGRVNAVCRSAKSLVGSSRSDGNICSRENNFDGSGLGTIRSSHLDPTVSRYVSGLESDVQFLKSDRENKTFSDMVLDPKITAASSSFQTALRSEELGLESSRKVQSSWELAHEMSSEKPYSTNTDSNTGIDTNLNCGQNQEGKVSLTLKTDPQDKNLIGLTFCRKAPATNWVDRTSTRALSCPVISYLPCTDVESRNCLSDGKSLDEILPFFMDHDKKTSYHEDNDMAVSNSTLQQEAPVGIPVVYQNDGSYLYLLSPIVSPPTAENVKRWLLAEHFGTSIEDNKVAIKSSALEGTSGAVIGSPNSSPGDCDKASPESGSTFIHQHIQPPGSQENCNNISTILSVSCYKKATAVQRGVDPARVKTYPASSQEISQISGPDGKSKSTPLSQTGFRDPASVGGGQQLTLLSIEVQAASRGDLRPDPQFDAINIIALAVQTDSDYDAEIHVLLFSKSEGCLRNLDGTSGCNMLIFSEEKCLLDHFIKFICSLDPDILMGWDVQGGSLGFLAERASHLGVSLLNCISRTPIEKKGTTGDAEIHEKGLDSILPGSVDPVKLEDEIISDEWGRTHASGVHVGGRIVLNVWRLMRGELNLNMYTVEAVADAVLRRKIPHIPYKVLTKWNASGPGRARYRCIEFVKARAKLNLELMNQLDMINRTSELARVFGIDFFSVLSRGSQYRVESMYLRLAHTQNYLSISPGSNQVASQPAMECLPLVMEPESGFYADPVVVLDFQSLYPSMIIGYNLCYSTCLGNTVPSKRNVLGVATFSPNPHILQELKDKILLTPNGVMYVQSRVRKGVLPRLLEEILSTRIMVKQAMKKLSPSQQVLHRIFNARQLALKLIANVTYGYTAAGFSGRMPCAELADSIVQCGRRTLENAISFVNYQEKWKARVIYGDTDSMFVLLKGRSVEDAFRIGNEIASEVSAMNPNPVVLKMEKVYHPCFLLTKKRYVGYSYENLNQKEPVFDAKGIETVRRDTCRAVSKTLEQSLRLYFEHQDISEVKEYLQRQWKRILSGRVSLQDFIFAKEVRLGTYSSRDSSSLPPSAIVATKAMRTDPRAEPRYGDRVPYIVVHGQPGARLIDMVVDPSELLAIDSPYRLNDGYYIKKQIIPALQRVFGLVGANLSRWFSEMPQTSREAFGKRPAFSSNPVRARIDHYYLSKHCVLCGELVEASAHLCRDCSQNGAAAVAAVVGRTSKLEREMQHLAAICRHCGGGDWVVESGVKCTSLACPVFFERCKVQKELQGLATVAAHNDLYPKCKVEWF